jgi:hypothetical protein
MVYEKILFVSWLEYYNIYGVYNQKEKTKRTYPYPTYYCYY